MYCFNGAVYNINNGVGGRGGRQAPRATGRGTPDDPDVPQGRPRQKYLSHHRALSHGKRQR